MTSIREALGAAEAGLGGDEARREAELLLAWVLGRERVYLYTWPETALDPSALARFQALVARRARGEPLAYLLGRREFWSLDLQVDPRVLIPRPDTEVLVELALECLPDGPLTVADLGTGSGAIALALATERPQWQLIATDRSEDALAVARSNARRLGVRNVEFRAGDWGLALAGPVDAMVSNPPYIAPADPHLAQGDLRHEPVQALVAGDAGLADLRAIVRQAPARLRPGGWLLLEHGYAQGDAVRELLRAEGFRDIASHRDLGDNERVSVGRLPSATGKGKHHEHD